MKLVVKFPGIDFMARIFFDGRGGRRKYAPAESAAGGLEAANARKQKTKNRRRLSKRVRPVWPRFLHFSPAFRVSSSSSKSIATPSFPSNLSDFLGLYELKDIIALAFRV